MLEKNYDKRAFRRFSTELCTLFRMTCRMSPFLKSLLSLFRDIKCHVTRVLSLVMSSAPGTVT